MRKLWDLLPLPVRRRIIWSIHPTFTLGVSAVLLNQRNEILLLRHRLRERRGWELPGGLVERGERLEEAIQREIREETGYDSAVLSLLTATIGPSLHVDVCFLVRTISGSLVLDYNEIVEGQFFPYAELRSILEPAQLGTINLGFERVRQNQILR